MQSEEFIEFFRAHGRVPNRNEQAHIRRMMKEIYEWGSVSCWDLTRGLQGHDMSAYRLLKECGLIGDHKPVQETMAYVTDDGMAFVEKYKLSSLVP